MAYDLNLGRSWPKITRNDKDLKSVHLSMKGAVAYSKQRKLVK